MEAGYSGLFVEYIVPLKDRAKLSFLWTTGKGLTQYLYNKKFRENKLWYEEIIDRERWAVNKLAAEFMFRLAGNWWLACGEENRLVVRNNLQPKISSGISTGHGQKNMVKRYAIVTEEPPKFMMKTDFYEVKLPLLKPK